MSAGNSNGASARVDPTFFSVSAGASPNPTPPITLPPGQNNFNGDEMDVDPSSDGNPFQSAQDALGPAALANLASADPSSMSDTTPSSRNSTSNSKRSASKKSTSATTTPAAKTSRVSKRRAISPTTAAAADSTSTSTPDQPPKPKRAKFSSKLHVGEVWVDPSTLPVPLFEQQPDLSLDRRSRRSAAANLNYNENKLSAAKEAAARAAAEKEARASKVNEKGGGEEHSEGQNVEEPVKATRKSRASAASKGKGKAKGKSKAKAAAEPADLEVPSSDQTEAEGEQEENNEEGDADDMDVDQEIVPQPASKSKSKMSKKSAPTKSKSRPTSKPKARSSASTATLPATTRSTRRSASLAASYVDPETEDEEQDSIVDVISSPPRPRLRRSINSSATALEVAAANAGVDNQLRLPPTRTAARRSGRALSTASMSTAGANALPAPALPNSQPMPAATFAVGDDTLSELSDLDDDEHLDAKSVDSDEARQKVSLQPVQGPVCCISQSCVPGYKYQLTKHRHKQMEPARSRHSRNKQIRESSAPTSPVAATSGTSTTAADADAVATASSAESAARIATLESQLADVHKEVAALRSASNQHALLTTDLDGKREEIEELRADLHAIQADFDHEHRRSLRFQEEVGELQAQILALQATLADVNKDLDAVTKQRDEYDVRLTQAETQLAKRTRGGGAYEFERSPVTVSNAASALKQVVSGFARNVLAAPANKSRQAKEVYPKMIKVLREAAVAGGSGGLGYVPNGADAEDGFKWFAATPEGVQALEAMGNRVVGVSVSTNAHVDLASDDACPWSTFEFRISQAVSMLTAITLHTSALDTSFAEWRANAATTALAVAEVYYHASDLNAPGAPKHVQRMDLGKVVEDGEWAAFFARVRRVLDAAYLRVGVHLADDAALSARLDVLIRRFAVLWFMVPAIDPNWIVTFYPTGVRAPVAEKFMHETLLEVEDGPGEEDEDRAAVLVLLTAVPAVLVRDQEIVISPASGVRLVVPKELAGGAGDEKAATANGDAQGQDVQMGEAEKDGAADDSSSDVEVLDVDADDEEDVKDGDGREMQQTDVDSSMVDISSDDQLPASPGFSLASDLQLADRLLRQVQTPSISSGSFSSPPRSASATLDAIIAGTSTGVASSATLLLEFASSITGPAPGRSSATSSPDLIAGPPCSHHRAAPPAQTPDRRTSFIGSLGSSLMSLVTGSPSPSPSQTQFQQYQHQYNGSSSQ
ncbi:hypothetical protein BCR44DRAFT_1439029 [Catenaria anguillulae PL171]|uniref:Uncharacterized protein n=1 Tax=Catenaria anguillulae PL171 TaxID=765915 RepID=A0A1Y2HJ07_9FUNG|nr:hypothetical protein BCR44DRAFT_1439029 [Catenaria anguillulae PL171]